MPTHCTQQPPHLIQMSFTTKLGDEFLKVPKLDASGKDWPLWKGRLELSLAARGLLGYLSGKTPMLANPAAGKPSGWSPATADEVKAMKEYEKELTEWVEKDAVVRQQIAVVIPNTLFVKLLSKSTAKEYYDTLKAQFEQRSLVVSIELRHQLGELKLKNGGDARTHIEKMMMIREELASMGKPVSDEDLFNMIFASLPRSYNTILSTVASSIKLLQRTLTADDLMGLVIDEYDRYLLQDGAKSKSKGGDEVFGADAKRGKGKGKGKTKAEGDCHNCGKPGHWKEDCWAEGGGKEGQGPKGRKPRGKKDTSSTSGESSKGNKADVTADDDEEDRKSLRTRTLIWRMEMMRVINLHPLHLSRTGELRDGQFKRASGTSHLTD